MNPFSPQSFVKEHLLWLTARYPC